MRDGPRYATKSVHQISIASNPHIIITPGCRIAPSFLRSSSTLAMQTYSPSGLVTVFLSVLSNAILTRCKSQTYIADDEMADLNPSKNSLITYLPSNDSWAQGNKLPNFGGLDISKAWASTWHNASTSGSSSTMPSLNFTFNGSSVFEFEPPTKCRCVYSRHGRGHPLHPSTSISDQPHHDVGWRGSGDVPNRRIYSR